MRRCLLVRGVILNSAFFAVQFTLHSVFLRAWSCMFFDGLAYIAKSVLEAFVADISVVGFGIRVLNVACLVWLAVLLYEFCLSPPFI